MKANNWSEIEPGIWGNPDHPQHTICTNGETFTAKRNGATIPPSNRAGAEINDFMKDIHGSLSPSTTKF
jgi:hypothetical protein